MKKTINNKKITRIGNQEPDIMEELVVECYCRALCFGCKKQITMKLHPFEFSKGLLEQGWRVLICDDMRDPGPDCLLCPNCIKEYQ